MLSEININEDIKNAPIGELKPSKYSFGFSEDVTLNLESLIATARTRTKEINLPNSTFFKKPLYIMAAGATPKVTRSAIESNSIPNFDEIFNALATRPSNMSKISPKTTK